MRAVRWTLAALAALFGLIALAAWFVPPLLDWTRYRGEIVALASGTLGRSVRIDGPISLTLLPEPVLTAATISVDEGEAKISVKTLRLRVAFWPLLRGKVLARDLVMRDFDMRLPWPLSTPAEVVQRQDWLAATSARIEHGRVTIGGLTVTDIDADLSTGTPLGTYTASGMALVSGRPWHFSMRMSQPGMDGSVAVDVAFDGQGPLIGSGATLSGQIDSDGALSGRVTARGPDLSAILPAPPVPFKADGRLTVEGGLAAADDLAVEIGGSPATAAVALRVSPSPRLDVALTASRLDLDAWLPTMLSGSAVRIPTGIDLSAEAGQLAGGLVRRLRAAFDIDGDGVQLRDIAALLPGDADVQMAGRITHQAGRVPRFDGDATLAAPSMRMTLAWLEKAGFGTFSVLPDAVLRTAQLTGHVTISRGHLGVSALSGTIDSTKVEGSIGVSVGPRMALTAALHTGKLDLDQWLPTALPPVAALPTVLSGLDADVQIDAQSAIYRGIGLAPFALDAKVIPGQVNLRRLEAAAGGVKVLVSGTVGPGGRVTDGHLDVQAKDATEFSAYLPDEVQRWATVLLRSPLSMQVQASGAPNALALQIAADLGDLRLEAQPIIDLQQSKWAGPMTLRHPGAPRLAETLGLNGAPAWLGDGSLALVARVRGEPKKLSADEFDITAGALHATGRLGVDWAGVQPHVSGTVSAESLPVPLPYPRARDPMPLGILSGWTASVRIEVGRLLVGASLVAEKLSADMSLADRTFRIDRIAAMLGGGSVTGSVSLSTTGSVPALSIVLGVAGATISGPVFDEPIDLSAGAIDGSITARATGYSPAAMLATLNGDVTVKVEHGQIAGFDLAHFDQHLTEANVDAALAPGTTAFETLNVSARIDRGSVMLTSGRLISVLGETSVSGTIGLPSASCDLRLEIRPAVPDAPRIGLRLTGPLDSPNRTYELADLTRWRLAHVQADAH
jgi:hypothetical protein